MMHPQIPEGQDDQVDLQGGHVLGCPITVFKEADTEVNTESKEVCISQQLLLMK